MKRKTVFWIVLFAALFALGAGLYLLGGGGSQAVISVDGEVWDTVDLNAVTEAYEFTVETDYGWNTVMVAPGNIRVIDADCPHQDCVKQGFISDGAIPIVCLPHKLVIEIEE